MSLVVLNDLAAADEYICYLSADDAETVGNPLRDLVQTEFDTLCF